MTIDGARAETRLAHPGPPAQEQVRQHRPPAIGRLAHPGPPADERIQQRRSTAIGQMEALRPGAPLAAELIRMVRETGSDSGFAEIFAGDLSPLDYCVPEAGDERSRVSYSPERHSATGRVVVGSATIGLRHGEPFVHCHLQWIDEHGIMRGGHVWPSTLVGERPPVAVVCGLPALSWLSTDDPETNMPTFAPHSRKDTIMSEDTGQAIVARVLPHEDIIRAIQQICREAGWERAVVRAGLGSLVGARLRDLHTAELIEVDGPGTEVISISGLVAVDDPETRISCTLVDRHGTVHSGLLEPGLNPVAITFELSLQPIA